jgi:hypothetical protein
MKKFIYLWLDGYNRLDDYHQEKGYLFEDIGLNLSSEFFVSHEKKNDVIDVHVKRNSKYQENFFSGNISDVKVLVGNNGTGKSTIINILFDIIANNGFKCKSSESIFILYEEEKEIYCYSAKWVSVDIVELPDGYSKGTKKISFKKDIPIYYSSEFDCYSYNNYLYNSDFCTFDFDNSDYRNISTSALYYRDETTVLLSQMSENEYDSRKRNKLSYHREMEQNRLLDLILNAGKKFFDIIPIPQKIVLCPIQENIECGIEVLAKILVKEHSSWTSLYDILPDSYFGDITRDEDDEEEMKEIVEKFLYDCRSSILNDVDNLLRFAIMMNCIRSFSNDKELDLIYDINWKLFRYEPQKVIQQFFDINPFIPIGKLGKRIESIIRCTEKCDKYDGKVFFDLSSNGFALQQVKSLYNYMHTGIPALQFKFTRALSSGENEFLRFYSRLYDCIKKVSRNNLSLDSIYLFVDEADLFLHPEWQRKWFDTFISLIDDMKERLKKIPKDGCKNKEEKIINSGEKIKIQLIVATHSPFMLTDCLSENVLKLRREDNFGKVFVDTRESSPLAGNILDILQTGFFLKSSMGVLTENKINDLINHLKSNSVRKDELLLLENIGDPILKTLLKRKK